jgi:hypothetical protein
LSGDHLLKLGVRGAVAFGNSCSYCGAAVSGPWEAGVASIMKNGDSGKSRVVFVRNSYDLFAMTARVGRRFGVKSR